VSVEETRSLSFPSIFGEASLGGFMTSEESERGKAAVTVTSSNRNQSTFRMFPRRLASILMVTRHEQVALRRRRRTHLRPGLELSVESIKNMFCSRVRHWVSTSVKCEVSVYGIEVYQVSIPVATHWQYKFPTMPDVKVQVVTRPALDYAPGPLCARRTFGFQTIMQITVHMH
jgi:hypothetical protein